MNNTDNADSAGSASNAGSAREVIGDWRCSGPGVVA
jgi:hypothetical protein